MSGEPQRKFTRRDFLKWAGVTGAAAGGAGALKLLENLRRATQTPSQQKDIDLGDQKKNSLVEEELGDIRVFYTNDAERRPVSFIKTNGEQIFFDTETLRQAKATAEQTNQRQLAAFVKLGESPARPTQWNNKELVRSLPDDVVSTEELVQRGVEVIPAESVEFYIRTGAFAKEGLLESYKEGSNNRLVIALVDSVMLTPESLSDPKYESLRALAEYIFKRHQPREPHEVRDREIDWLKRDLELTSFNEQQLRIQEKIAAWNVMTDQEIVEAGLTGGLRGRYFMPKEIAEKHQDVGLQGTAVIMLAVRDTPRPHEYLSVFARPDKDWMPYNTVVTTIDLGITQISSFHPDRGFPSPDDFEKEPYASPTGMLQRYLYLDPSAGFSLRHELTHDQRLNIRPTGDVEVDANEYWTDVSAMQGIADAHDQWSNSGKNSGYYFVFRRKGDPYFILTKQEQEQRSTSL